MSPLFFTKPYYLLRRMVIFGEKKRKSQYHPLGVKKIDDYNPAVESMVYFLFSRNQYISCLEWKIFGKKTKISIPAIRC